MRLKFYNDLDDVISATSSTDKPILLGDFNARVGTDHQTGKGVIGPEGVGKCNSNGLLLLRKCVEHDLLNTIVFRLSNRLKQNILDAPPFQTLASHRLCFSAKNRLAGCQSDKDYVWCILLDRS